MYKARIIIKRRPSILEPEGKAVRHALGNLGYASVDEVRMGKFAEIWIDEEDRERAEQIAQEACDKLLANPVMEDYAIELDAVEPAENG